MAKSKSTLFVGAAVVFVAADNHLTKTVRGEQETIGSTFHPNQTEFAGIVGRVDAEAETVDILIFPPSRDPKWVTGVSEGDGPGLCSLAGK